MDGQESHAQSCEIKRQNPASRESLSNSLTQGDLATDVQTLAALGNDTRYEAIRVISEAENDVCVCELESALSVGQSAVSKALSKLFSAELIERRKEGRLRYYTTTPNAESLLSTLDEARSTNSD